MDILERISQKGIEIETVADEVIASPDSTPQLFEGLFSKKGTIRFGCEKVIRLISEAQPEIIYPYFDRIASLLESENNILRWGAIIIIANLAAADSEGKFEKIFDKYFAPVTGKQMITASNIVKNAWKIASAKPSLVERISREVLKVEDTVYEKKGKPSSECNSIVCGHAIDSFSKFYEKIKNKKPVKDFIKRQAENPRSTVAKKAQKFARKYKIYV